MPVPIPYLHAGIGLLLAGGVVVALSVGIYAGTLPDK